MVDKVFLKGKVTVLDMLKVGFLYFSVQSKSFSIILTNNTIQWCGEAVVLRVICNSKFWQLTSNFGSKFELVVHMPRLLLYAPNFFV